MGEAFILAWLALAFQNGCPADPGCPPYYTAASIANTAASVAGLYAPNTFVSIYGLNLSAATTSLSGSGLSIHLPGAEVTVLVAGLPADLWYASPGLVNLLIPNQLTAGPAILQLEVDGVAGPPIQLMLGSVAPAMFQADATTVLAAHLNGQVISAGSPARPGELVVLYAAGLGATLPPAMPNQPPIAAATLVTPGFQVWLNGIAVDPSNVPYAGVTPGYAGLYQVNLRLPADAPPNPEIRIGWPSQMSPAQLFLPLQE
jgi:uncharacterized protein (TIGR03437 family)